MTALIYTVTYYLVLNWNALPDGVHFLMADHHAIFGAVKHLLAVIGYVLYEDGSIGW